MLLDFPAMPVFTLANTAVGRKRRRRPSATARTAPTPDIGVSPTSLRMDGWTATGLIRQWAPPVSTPIIGSRKAPSATEQPAREKAEPLGPMMENFDTFLDYYEPTDEQVSLGSLLLLGIGDPDATMERLLMSMMGSLEAHGQAAEAGIDF